MGVARVQVRSGREVGVRGVFAVFADFGLVQREYFAQRTGVPRRTRHQEK